MLLPKEKESDYGPVEVPPGHFFAMGDNRGESRDSRIWGPVPRSCLKGLVSYVWLSLDGAGGLRKDRSGLWVNALPVADLHNPAPLR